MLTMAEIPCGPGRTVEILDDLASVETLWRVFEQTSLATPYARFDWVRAFAENADPAAPLKLLVIRDVAGRLEAVWPLAVTRRFGLRLARPVGGKHANYNLPLLRTPDSLGPDPAELLRTIGRALRVDVLWIPDMPDTWNGLPNPLAPLGQAGPNVTPEVQLDADHELVTRRSMSNEARKRLRNKERGLAKLGPVSFGRATGAAEVGAVLEAFFRQKAARFEALGIPDPFADPAVRRFVEVAAAGDAPGNAPAIELYALRVGDMVAAVLGGAADRDRLSGMFISFEACPEATKYSPGDILVSRVIQEQCRLGRRHFDLGNGDAAYKRAVLDAEIHLLNLLVPITARGRLAAGAGAFATEAKRRLKADPRAMALLARIRRAKSRNTAAA